MHHSSFMHGFMGGMAALFLFHLIRRFISIILLIAVIGVIYVLWQQSQQQRWRGPPPGWR
jgi:predicted lipid-binding transport protein (Tim44 family)